MRRNTEKQGGKAKDDHPRFGKLEKSNKRERMKENNKRMLKQTRKRRGNVHSHESILNLR